jgi:hypothetical protein
MRGAQSVTADLSAHGMGQPKVLRARHAFVTGVRALRYSRGHLRGPGLVHIAPTATKKI